jgi:hypothetical protein
VLPYGYRAGKEVYNQALGAMLQTPAQRPPDELTSYNNAAYAVLGSLIQAVTGQNYYDYMEETVLPALGMDGARLYQETPEMVDAHLEHWAFAEPQLALGPAGSLAASGRQMGRLLTTLSDLYQEREEGLWTKENFLSMMEPQNPRWAWPIGWPVGLGTFPSGLGLRTQKAVFSHNGGMAGFSSLLTWIPEEDLGVAIVSNKNTGWTASFGQRVLRTLRLLKGLPSEEPEAQTFLDGSQGRLSYASAEEILGQYSAPEGIITIEDPEHLSLDGLQGRSEYRLRAIDQGAFQTQKISGDGEQQFTFTPLRLGEEIRLYSGMGFSAVPWAKAWAPSDHEEAMEAIVGKYKPQEDYRFGLPVPAFLAHSDQPPPLRLNLEHGLVKITSLVPNRMLSEVYGVIETPTLLRILRMERNMGLPVMIDQSGDQTRIWTMGFWYVKED